MCRASPRQTTGAFGSPLPVPAPTQLRAHTPGRAALLPRSTSQVSYSAVLSVLSGCSAVGQAVGGRGGSCAGWRKTKEPCVCVSVCLSAERGCPTKIVRLAYPCVFWSLRYVAACTGPEALAAAAGSLDLGMECLLLCNWPWLQFEVLDGASGCQKVQHGEPCRLLQW